MTARLIEARRKQMVLRLEESIKTAVDRELYAKMKIRQELVAKTEAGDVQGVKALLLILVDEAVKSNSKLRYGVNAATVGVGAG